MSWQDSLERRFGALAIPGLIRIIVAFNALVFVLAKLNPDYLDVLVLDPARIRHGEVWRLVSYIFIPQTLNPLWAVFALGFLWFIGEGVERAWGAFRLNLYYLLGMIGTTAVAFFFRSEYANGILNSTLFFAFARFYPEEMIYIFFILPVKIKWLAWASAAFLLLGFITGTNSYRLALVAGFSNYLIFFGPEIFHEFRQRKDVKARRARFADESIADETLHHCATCGATEQSSPNLEFRVARDGEEYCLAHLPSAAAGQVVL